MSNQVGFLFNPYIIQTVIGVILCNPLDFPDEGLTIKRMQ